MVWRRRGWVLLATVAATAGVILLERAPVRPETPAFVELAAALEPLRADGWELSAPPRRPGPYRLHAGGAFLGPHPGERVLGRVFDRAGGVAEEAAAGGAADRDHLIVHLATPGGDTMAVLVRIRRAGPGDAADPPKAAGY